MHIAHGVVISIVIVLFFPLGSIILRLSQLSAAQRSSHSPPRVSPTTLHIAWQSTGLVVLLAGFGLGCWLSYLHRELWDFGHQQMGTVVVGGFAIQALLGGWAHRRFLRRRAARRGFTVRSEVNPKGLWVQRVHVWFGRCLVLAGMVCGGTGIQLAANWTLGQMLIYVVVVCVVAGIWGGVVLAWYLAGRGEKKEDSETGSVEALRGRKMRVMGEMEGGGVERYVTILG